MTQSINRPSCWVITTGEAGMKSQALGLASAIGIEFEHKLGLIPPPWKWLPGYMTWGVLSAATLNGKIAEPPWPDLLITCGGRPAVLSMAIKRASGGRTLTVHVQDPRISPRHFDLVVPPRHDRLTGSNVISTRGAVHLVTKDRLESARQAFSDVIAELPRPLIGVLLGGTSNSHRGDDGTFADLGGKIAGALKTNGGSAWITPSRRTPDSAVKALKTALGDAHFRLWPGPDKAGQDDNPYFAILAASDYLLVTSDSVSMVTEACATGKPVYITDLPGGTKRFRRFHQDMRDEGATRPFTGILAPPWSYEPVNDTQKVATAVRELMERSGFSL